MSKSLKNLPYKITASVLMIALLSSCKVGPDYLKPDTKIDDSFHAKANYPYNKDAVNEEWWKVFNDKLLNEIIEDAVNNNKDIKIALANIEGARALRKGKVAGLMPSVSADAGAGRTKYSEKTSPLGTVNAYNAGLDAAWELDVFGKIRRGVEASDARLEGFEAQKNAIMLSIMAEVASNYFEVRGLQKRIDVTTRSVGLLKEVETLAKAKYKAGIVTEFDVSRARGEREAIEAKLPNLEAQMQAGIYTISLLSGKEPEYYLAKLLEKGALPPPPDIVPVGMRSEILRRRPDIIVAERNLAAASADIGVATGDLFPSISLTGAVGTSARVFSDVFTGSAGAYSLGSALSWSVFNGGATHARIDAAKATSKASLAAYEKAVLAALSEVETSLSNYGGEWNTLKKLKAAEGTRQDGFKVAKLRYESGQENFLTIIDAERSLITAQDDVIQSESRILVDLTQLYKTLGGGWQEAK
jgi:multidrug efflux system outer membrane protein